MFITGLIMAKNEERCIARCINSVKDIVDELVVVDTGSSDNTVDIARSMGAVIVNISWENDFSAGRNAALKHASGEWVIFLDADEFFRKGDEKNLRLFLESFKKNCPTKQYEYVSRIYVDRWDYNAADYTADDSTNPEIAENPLPQSKFQITANARILRNSDKFAYVGYVHETYGLINGQDAPSMYATGIVLYHDGYSGKLLDEKLKRNISLLQEELPCAQGTRRALTLSYLGASFLSLNEPQKAIPFFREYVNNPHFSYQNAVMSHISYIRTLEMLNSDEKTMLTACDKIIENHPGHPSFYLVRAFQYFRYKRYSECEKDLRETFERKRDFNFGIEWESSRLFELYPAAYTLAGNICCSRGELDDGYHFFLAACHTAIWLKRNLGLDKYSLFKPSGLRLDIEPMDRLILCSRVIGTKTVIRDLKTLIESEDDLRRLLEKLRLYRADEVYLHFFHEWNRDNQKSGVFFFTAMTVIGNYDEALKGLLWHYSQTESESYLKPALLAAALGGEPYLRKFMHSSSQNYHDVAAGLFYDEPIDEKYKDMVLALMEGAIRIAPKHGLVNQIEALLLASWGIDILLPVARLFYNHMYFSEAVRCCQKILDSAPPDFNITNTARLLMETSVAGGNLEHFEESMILSLAYGVSPVHVKQYLVWALEISNSLSHWLIRVDCWEKLYLHDIFPENVEQQRALAAFFEAMENKGSQDSIAVRNLLHELWQKQSEMPNNEQFNEQLELQRKLRAQIQSLNESIERKSTIEQNAENQLQEIRKLHQRLPMLI